MTTYEKIVKGATKVKIAAPKPKYIEPILMATSIDHPAEYGNLNTIMRTLQSRLQDSAWSVVYKSLIVIHIMIREGDKDVTLNYMSERSPGMLNLSGSNISNQNELHSDVKFVLKYAKYLHTRVKQFENTGIDYVRDERSSNSTAQNGGRLRSLSVDKGLLRESESVQKQIDGLLKNNFMENEIKNDIIVTAFRLLVNDLLSLFQELNEGVINLLEHYFEMSKVDAERALRIYKKFVDQTKYVIDYLRVAKHLEHATKLHVPTIKHAPTALTSSLEEYLDDPNFESNRLQYLAEKSGKINQTITTDTNAQAQFQPKQQQFQSQAQTYIQQPVQQQNHAQQPAAQQFPASNLVRNPSLIVQQSTYNPWANVNPQIIPSAPVNGTSNSYTVHIPMSSNETYDQNQAPQVFSSQTGGLFTLPSIPQGQEFQLMQGQSIPQIPSINTGHFSQPSAQAMNSSFTGNGFGGYGPQVQQPTGSNPFLQNFNGANLNTPQFQAQPQSQQMQSQVQQQNYQQAHLDQQQTQPFLTRSNTNPFLKSSQSLGPTSTGSNPFASSRFSHGSNTTAFTFNNDKPQPIAATSTGTNPFKVSQNTNALFDKIPQQGTQLKPQPTAGGLEHLPTIPVFPSTQKEAEHQYYLNNARAGIQQQATGYQSYEGPSLI